MMLSDFDFDLPDELIAQQPLARRADSRLLHLSGTGLQDRQFNELPSLLHDGDLLVVNDSRVLPARLFGHKDSGGQVEILVERILAPARALAMVRASKSPRTGARVELDGGAQVTVARRDGMFFVLDFSEPVLPLLLRAGTMPLPPYIRRQSDSSPDSPAQKTTAPDVNDAERYQTVYATEPGSVAAPTAGLHFDDALLARLANAGTRLARVTLHVGAGTFAPVRVDDLSQHRMHSERYQISPEAADAINTTRRNGGRVIAVGTTSLRTLESAALLSASADIAAGDAETSLFVTPGFEFRVADALITNFHLPRSTLLMLVSAFAGTERIRAAYQHAISQRYRFFSYGDAMFIDLPPPGKSGC